MKKILIITILVVAFMFTACLQQTDTQEVKAIATQEQQIKTPITTNQKPTETKEQTATETIVQDDIDESESTSNLILTYPIVDSGQTDFYSDRREISEPSEGDAFYGQDANYAGNQPSYTDNGDGMITDNVTGLMWQKTMDSKMTFSDAFDYAEDSTIGGYDDWRMPTIKELWSLMQYTGQSGGEKAGVLFIDTDYFDQPLGDTSAGEREIDAQVWSATEYTGLTMKGGSTVFGVNFVDGRIKGYGSQDPRGRNEKSMYVRLVRGNTEYGINNFVDNGDGTISDLATGLMWQQSDDGRTRDWEDSLSYAESAETAGYSDWRLPSAKELQSIVDYSNSPQANGKPAIDDLFTLTEITDTKGDANYGFYWTSTSHLDGRNIYDGAAYVCFGEGLGQMNGQVMDVHGAGALRSDPKSGNADDYPQYFGPQGDIQYVYNFSILVRDIGN